MISISVGLVQEVITALGKWLGEPTTQQNGREIGMGSPRTKMKIVGPGWMIWTDHFRDSHHRTKVRAFLQFTDPRNETIFRLKHPELCG